MRGYLLSIPNYFLNKLPVAEGWTEMNWLVGKPTLAEIRTLANWSVLT